MGMFDSIILTLTGLLAIFLLYRSMKNNPEAFSKSNLNKSFSSMGILALILIGIISVAVVLLRK